jgi:hypothetical protein
VTLLNDNLDTNVDRADSHDDFDTTMNDELNSSENIETSDIEISNEENNDSTQEINSLTNKWIYTLRRYAAERAIVTKTYTCPELPLLLRKLRRGNR